MYVYRFVDKNKKVIYVGKTKLSLRTRFYSHKHLPEECYQKVSLIEYIECRTEADMSMKEIYYINQQHSEGNCEFNTADVSAMPQDFDFQDSWLQYKGSLPESFQNSVNYTNHFEDEKEEVITASDGRQMRLTQNSVAGVEKFVFPFTVDELSDLFSYFQSQMMESVNYFREYASFKNILLLAIGISTPFKSKEILDLKYSDLFDDDDEVRGYQLIRKNNTYVFSYPLPVIKLLYIFKNEYGFNFSNERDKYIFVGNKGEKLSQTSINKAITSACNEFAFTQRHSTESMRKTFLRNIFDKSENVYEAMECVEFMSGVYMHCPGRVLKYIDIIPHNRSFSPLLYIKDKYIINEIEMDWNIPFKYDKKWSW